ncbi:MAG: tail fiber domain-containing protein, partial [Cyclobacteriaceae bacterium]
EGNISVGDASDEAQEVVLSGDATISNAGVLSLTANSVETANIADGNITNAKLATDAVTTVNIVDGDVTNAKLATDAIESDNITNNSIIDADINSAASIAGTKIDPDFGTQDISTTGTATVSELTVTSLTNTGDVSTAGTLVINAGGVFTSSDKRLKENIDLLRNTLEKLDQLGGYNYNYKADREKKKQIGVIAQELEKVYPELVILNENGFKTVNYVGLVPVLIEALKEQQRMIDSLTKNIADQNARIDDLKAENSSMKSDINLIKAAIGISDKSVNDKTNIDEKK